MKGLTDVMIFEKLADGIMKHSKLIIAIWVVALVCSAPFITKAMDKLKYDMGDMADQLADMAPEEAAA